MNRYTFATIARFVFHLHYDIRMTGKEHILDGRTHLVLPNHTAYVDPVILCAECGTVPLRPMSDERFFRNPISRWVLRMADAIEVPDLEKTGGTGLRDKVAQTGTLSRIAIDSLAEGKELIFYPSGHVKTVDREVIGNRRLAYEVCRELPDNVEVILVRMRGLEQSVWSKLRPKNFRWRRTVTIHFESMTEQVREWATTLSRREFNQRLEQWYDQGLPDATK